VSDFRLSKETLKVTFRCERGLSVWLISVTDFLTQTFLDHKLCRFDQHFCYFNSNILQYKVQIA